MQAILDGRAVGVISWAHDLRREIDDGSLVGLVGPIILVRTPWEVGVVSVVRSNGPRDEAVYRFIELLLSEPIQREHTATGRRYPITNDEFAPNGLPPWSNVAPHLARDITDDMRRSEFRMRLDTLTARLQVGACGV